MEFDKLVYGLPRDIRLRIYVLCLHLNWLMLKEYIDNRNKMLTIEIKTFAAAIKNNNSFNNRFFHFRYIYRNVIEFRKEIDKLSPDVIKTYTNILDRVVVIYMNENKDNEVERISRAFYKKHIKFAYQWNIINRLKA